MADESPRDPHADPAALEQSALAAYLKGEDEPAADGLARAHAALLARGDVHGAARTAVRLGFVLGNAGESARAAGWHARAQRLIEEAQLDCAERGYLMLQAARQQVAGGNLAAAESTFAEAAAIGERFGERDLVWLARQGRGRALIGLGELGRGVALLDEVMIAVTASELSPVIAGIVYCSVISACFDIFDIRRAQEWTDALNRWCASQPGLVAYRGECLVHRAEIMRLQGVWAGALEEAHRACECLSGRPTVGAAFYQLGELHRVRGEFSQAEEAYRLAGESGRTPQPGLALLRLAQGRGDLATAAIRVAAETRDRRARSIILAASVDILLASGDLDGARAAAAELTGIAETIDTPLLRAIAAHATGAVLLAGGNPTAALAQLRGALTIWRDLEAPYEGARTTMLIGLAARALGDADTADMELGAARRVFQQLGAAPDAARVEALTTAAGPGAAAGPVTPLTDRELEVLRLVASGRTNRAIADALRISEKTVARHLSNIFTKLDLPSRAAATAYAFRHQLI
jgi:DNA-binding CsgD family transcriptional regulator